MQRSRTGQIRAFASSAWVSMKQTLEQSLEANDLIESCSNDTGSWAVAGHHLTDTSRIIPVDRKPIQKPPYALS